jgi:hypothetical protein
MPQQQVLFYLPGGKGASNLSRVYSGQEEAKKETEPKENDKTRAIRKMK